LPDRDELPEVVAFDTKGSPLNQPEASLTSSVELDDVFWQRPSRPPRGPCRLDGTQLPGLTAQWGHVARRIRPFADLLPPALVSCIDTEYHLDNWPLDAAVVLNAAHPDEPPKPLHDFQPVPGHPTDFQGPAWHHMVARRIPGAWLVVEGGRDLQQRLTVLEHLRASIHV